MSSNEIKMIPINLLLIQIDLKEWRMLYVLALTHILNIPCQCLFVQLIGYI